MKYLQIAMVGSPAAGIAYGCGDTITKEDKAIYKTLSQNAKHPQRVLPLWRLYAYESDVIVDRDSNTEFLVEEDYDGIYLMKKINFNW